MDHHDSTIWIDMWYRFKRAGYPQDELDRIQLRIDAAKKREGKA